MVIDTSALLAILQDEPEREVFTLAIRDAGHRVLSVATLLEATIVLEARYGAKGAQDLDLLIERARLTSVPVDADQVRLAIHGWRRFGKGRHRAGLNFGDCFTYGLARHRGESLLFKGNDFVHTDITPAV